MTFDLFKSEAMHRDHLLAAACSPRYSPLNKKAAEKKYLFIVRYFTKVQNQHICGTRTDVLDVNKKDEIKA